MIDLNTERKHETLYKVWKESFEQLVSGLIYQGKDVVFVAMSRKMPRLIEMVNEKFPDDNLNRFHFVSEHVLPYTLRHFQPESQCIVIADDAMYYGSTINRITGCIRALTSVKPYVCPVAVSEVVGSFLHAVVNKSHENTIRVRNIPFFTTQNAEWILKLNRPIDIEFPILHFNVSSESVNSIVEIEKILEELFPDNEIYSIEHRVLGSRKPVLNINVLPKKGSVFDRWNKDFCKMRFYFSAQSIQVVAYAPGILSETVLNDPHPLFSDDRIQSLWEDIKSYDLKPWPEALPEGYDMDLLVDIFQSVYETQCARSKIVWANYLASFLYLLEQKEAIVRAVSMIYNESVSRNAAIESEDLRLLLPSEKVSQITTSLNRSFKEGPKHGGMFYGLHSNVLAGQELVPEEFSYDYAQIVRKGLQRCRTADEALSVVFSNQHLFINAGRLPNYTTQHLRRLGFGITYTALENKLSFPVGIQGLWSSIHRWIDKNIDEGTIKPKYERVAIEGNIFWLRMFRAGENEDSYTKLRRLCEFIIGKVREKENRGYVERTVVDDLLTLVWADPCEIVKYSYRWDTFNIERDGAASYITIGNRAFLDYLIDQGYLQSIRDSYGFSRISTLDDSQTVTSLSVDQEQAVSDYVDAYYYYVKTCNQLYIMNNFLPQFDNDSLAKFYDMLDAWCRHFAAFMGNAISVEAQREIVSADYYALNESLTQIIQRSMKAAVIPSNGQENENRRKIQEWLQKVDVNEYGNIRNKLLNAMIVQELFNQLILVPEEEKESMDTLKEYLLLVKEDGVADRTIRNFLQMDKDDRDKINNRKQLVHALQSILPKRPE